MTMKKQLLPFLLILITSLACISAHAQDNASHAVENAIKKNGKYAFLVQNSRHFVAAVETGERFRAKSAKIKFEVVLVGPVVKDLVTDKELLLIVEKAKKTDVKIVACERAMAYFGVKKSELDPSVKTTSYGFTYFLGLQEMGFKTIEL